MNSLSLFSGCMGLDLGLEQAGIQAAVCVEADPSSRQTIQVNRPDIPTLDDVKKVTKKIVGRLTNKPIDWVVGGPPCQTFSTIGKRGSVADGRGQLIWEFVRVVREFKPVGFVMENVVGLKSAKDAAGNLLLPQLLSRFKRLGFKTYVWQLNSQDYGVAQKRKRVLIVGHRHQELFEPTRTSSISTLRDAIQDLEDNPGECARFGPTMSRVLDQIPEGGNWKSLSPYWRKKAMGSANTKSGGLTAFYRRLDYDKPSPTLLTSPTQRATTLCHPKHTRPLSVSEYQRIQGFPDTWHLAGGTAHKYRQLGNAVPVALAHAVGVAVMHGHNTRH